MWTEDVLQRNVNYLHQYGGYVFAFAGLSVSTTISQNILDEFRRNFPEG